MKGLLIALSMVMLFGYTTAEAAKQNSREKLIHDILLTTLSPHITNAVTGHYGELTQYALFDAKILDINRRTEGGYSYTVKVEILPFEGAHNTIGKDTITMEVNSAYITVIKYEHKDM